ncbi:MAG: hypothetical protein HJJLKODD_00810 [Phycisphaerae bacterium]|nr:hypothetical protein [Phycisphaerae bacterium]
MTEPAVPDNSASAAVNETQTIVNRALSRIGDIATLPAVTMRIIEIVENPKSTARDLHEVIKNDPALSAKVLKVVNSAFYGLPGQIASVDRAIVLLGLSAVKNIAIASSIARMFRGEKITDKFTAKDVWAHSVAVAVAARSLTRALGHKPEAEETFLAGLIHDLGILVERQAFGEQLTKAVNRTMAGEDRFLASETQVFGADHQMFGAALAGKWKFPKHLRACIGHHHDASCVSEEMQQVVALIQVADIIACQQQIGFYLTAEGATITPELLDMSHLTEEQVEAVRSTLAEETIAAEAVLMG